MNETVLPRVLTPMPDQIAASELVLSITLQCPLECAHCCVSSNMSQKGTLSWGHIEQAILEAAKIDTIEAVHYVGGDPFLKPQLMRRGIELASRLGLRSAATTSAFFAKTTARAVAVLRPLVEAGLSELTISYDDYHVPFVDEMVVVHASHAARQLDLPHRVSVVVEDGATIDAASVRRLLEVDADDPCCQVYECHVNSTGRGLESADAETLERRRRSDKVFRGPCDSILRTVTVSREGNVFPCCGVMPQYESMAVGNLADAPVDTLIERVFEDSLFRWISFEGPIEVLTTVTADDARPQDPSDFDGICTACDVLFRDQELLARAREHLPAKEPDLDAMEEALTLLGKFKRPGRRARQRIQEQAVTLSVRE